MEEVTGTETSGDVAAIAKCAHPDCSCTVETGQRYCSDYCMAQDGGQHAGEDADDECKCGHAECEHAHRPVAAPLIASTLPTS